MRKRIFKVFTTTFLSLMLATVAIAGTALAAEGDETSTCSHPYSCDLWLVEYEEANSMYHWATPYKQVICNDCHGIIDEIYYPADATYEEHDLSGYSNGCLMCVDCGYLEEPGTR